MAKTNGPPSPEEFTRASKPSAGGRRSPLDNMPDDAREWIKGCCQIMNAEPYRLTWPLVHAAVTKYWPDFPGWPRFAHTLANYCRRRGWARERAKVPSLNG